MSKNDTILSPIGIKYKNKKKGQEILLSNLLQCYGNDDYLIRGFYKKIKGYGLKQIEFGENVTLFRNNKKELLKKYFIREIDTKNGKYYSITPMGLIQYCKFKKLFMYLDITALLRFLEFNYNQSKSKRNSDLSKSLSKIIKNTNHNDLCRKFYEIISSIDIHDMETILTMDWTYKLPDGLDVLVNSIYYYKPTDEYVVFSFIKLKKSTEGGKKIMGDSFNHLFTKFIIKAFLHRLYISNLDLLPILEYEAKQLEGDFEIFGILGDIKEIKKSISSFDKITLDIVNQFNNELKSNIDLHSKQLDILI